MFVMPVITLLVLALTFGTSGIFGLDNGLGRTPPMGVSAIAIGIPCKAKHFAADGLTNLSHYLSYVQFNTWNYFGCDSKYAAASAACRVVLSSGQQHPAASQLKSRAGNCCICLGWCMDKLE